MMAIAPIEKDITPSGLTPEQIKKQAELESRLAFFQTQANDPKWTGKNAAIAQYYETAARNAAQTARVETALAKANAIDTSSLNQDITDAQAAIAAAEAAAAEAEGVIKSSKAGAQSGTTQGGSNTALNDLLLAQQKAAEEAAALRDRQSAYDILYNEFSKYGLGSLVEDVKYLLQSNVSPSQFALELQNTKAYKQRFSANEDRIKAGLSALTPKQYIDLEDQYQTVMRNYGLPASYYTKDTTGKQVGFDKFIAGDVSSTELEDRILTAQQRVVNSNPEVLTALKTFYGDSITNGDILAYALDPSKALTDIKRKVTAAEIGGAALAQNLQAQGTTAEALAAQGITKAQAQQGYTEVAGMVPRGSQLADIYGQQPYNQQTAEAEVFNTAGGAEAAARRKKLTELEKAQFSGQSGVGALGRDKALYGGAFGQAGQY
jgi:hypothetical protein